MWDILYLIDASSSMGGPSKLKGSMGESKIEAVKKAIAQVTTGPLLPYGARVGVMAFRAPTKTLGIIVDTKQAMIQEPLQLTPIQQLQGAPGRLAEALNSLKVGGGTPTGEGLRAAVEMLHRPDNLGARIKLTTLVTDGKSNFGPSPESLLEAGLARKAIINLVAVEKASDKRAFETLAARSGGKFSVVGDVPTLVSALNPRIPYAGVGEPDPLIGEAERVSKVLKMTDRSSPSYGGLVLAAEAVRQRMDRRLRDFTALEGEAAAALDSAVKAALNDPKWPRMSMKEFADRVWSTGADLSKLQAQKDAFRRAMGPLAV
ncbi:MAG: VWA domain-containing protein [Nitrososphaerota archaeon]|nr:VWA domain-containing protein [Nitrososphaerota archaeon]MDG7023162.1 VWA domain-containing protein [Nitrososphaerota archaeon]